MLIQECRPKTFEEMAGQELNSKILKAIIRKPETAPRTIILAGCYGVGKTSSARLFAKALNCESNRSKPCGVCSSCIQDIDRSTYYSEYDSSAMGNVDAIRELRDTFYYSPGKGYKVVVLDECHLMSRPAQSALLKVFEEAPARTFFILATTDVDKILPTIRSRSLELTYTSVSKADMVKNLLYICDQRGWNIPEDILDIIYKKSQGHMRNAHMLLDQFIMVGEEDFRQFVRSPKSAYLNYFKSIATKDKSLLFQSIDELSSFTLSDLKMDFQQVLLELVSAVVGYGSPDQRVIELVRQLGADTIKMFKSCCADWVLTSFTSDETMKACLLSIWQLVCKQASTGQIQQSMYDRAMKR